MISPELLRRFPFFGVLTEEQSKKVAMIAEEVTLDGGEIVFKSGEPAEAFYLLMEGALELYYEVVDERNPESRKEFMVGEINPGEPFGLSAVIEPRLLSATAKVTSVGKAIKIDAAKLCDMCDADPKMAYGLMSQIAKATMERLGYARTQLAAARS